MSVQYFTPIIVGLSGAMGAFTAALCDVMQKEEASAVLKLTQVVDVHLGLTFPALYTLAFFVAFGMGLALIFGSLTNKSAFYTGAGVIAMFMTATPFQTQLASSEVTEAQSTDASSGFSLFSVAYADSHTSTQVASGQKSNLRLNLNPPHSDGSLLESIITIRDPKSARRLWSGKLGGSTPSLYIAPGEYQVSVHTEGYAVKEIQVQLTQDEKKEYSVELVPTNQPKFLQRLLRPGG